MNVKEIKLADLRPYENNPRRNEEAVAYVANSIREFGFRVPLVIDGDNVIVCGHTRYLAAQELGMETVPCTIADDLTEDQIQAYRLADNKTAEMAGWDRELLEIELETIEMDMAMFGFNLDTDFDLPDDLFTEAEPKEKEPKKMQCPHCGEWFEV